MAEYFEREALIKKLRIMPIPKQAGSANTWLDNCAAGVNAAIREVASFPAADVAPVVHGRWEQDADGDWYCTNCNEVVSICESGRERTYRKPYCPNCGAKMDGGADHADD